MYDLTLTFIASRQTGQKTGAFLIFRYVTLHIHETARNLFEIKHLGGAECGRLLSYTNNMMDLEEFLPYISSVYEILTTELLLNEALKLYLGLKS
jgi:hypothetical protein